MIRWPLLLAAIFWVESRDGQVTENTEGAIGPAQIHAGAVSDLNHRYGTSYAHSAFKNATLSRWAVIHYSRMYGAKTEEDVARIWNAGPGGWEKGRGQDYWMKVRKRMKELENVEQQPATEETD